MAGAWMLWGDLDAASLPKVSLHDHLDGALRPRTIVELAAESGFALPAHGEQALADWFHESADSGSLTDYLATFDVTLGVMQTAPQLERIAREYVEDLVADGVLHGEVRWAPEQHGRAGLTPEQAVQAVQAGLEQGMAAAEAAGHAIRVGQLVSAMRHQHWALPAAELAVAHRDRGVVGFDIAGPEAGFPPSQHRVAFDYLAEQSMPVTVHAGEADGPASIRSALIDGRALRLGHGVRIAEDLDVQREDDSGSTVTIGPLARWVRDRRIPLELSPQSNLQTGAVAEWGASLADHPFDLLYQLGFHVTVNTDNRLMSNTSLSKELTLLADEFDYDLDDLLTFQLNAAEAAFLPLEEREQLRDRLTRAYDEL